MNEKNKVDIVLVNQLSNLYGFSNEELRVFYIEFKKLDLDKKLKLLINLDGKIKNRNNQLGSLLTSIKIENGKINEMVERKKELKEINFNI